MAHYPVDAWAAYLRGAGTEAERERMAVHAFECDDCASLLESVAVDQAFDAGTDVPQEVVDAAVRLFTHPQGLRPQAAVPALLVFDSARPRSDRPAGPPRALAFEADDIRIDLRVIEGGPGARALDGRLSDAESGKPVFGEISIHAAHIGGALATVATDASGGFALAGPVPEASRLLIQVAGPHQPIEAVLDLA